MNCLFFFRPDQMLDLIGVGDKGKYIYEFIEQQTGARGEISLRTFKNFIQGKGKLSPKTVDVLQKKFQIDFDNEILNEHDSLWWKALEKIKSNVPKEFFPYAMQVWRDVAKQENELIYKMKQCSTERKRIKAFASCSFVFKTLNEQEYLVLKNAKSYKEIKILSTLLLAKTLLYIVASFDVEYGLKYQEIHKEDKYSFIKKILPIYSSEKEILHPVGRFFSNIKANTGKTFEEMAKSIDIEGFDGIKLDSQKRKFRLWRKGIKIPHMDKIVKMMEDLFPEVEAFELGHIRVMYSCVVGVATLFNELLYVSHDGKEIFKSDLELVDWIHGHYSLYHGEHYKACSIKRQAGHWPI